MLYTAAVEGSVSNLWHCTHTVNSMVTLVSSTHSSRHLQTHVVTLSLSIAARFLPFFWHVPVILCVRRQFLAAQCLGCGGDSET